MKLILISGMAGAGKTTALRILEDSGYYCVDNLPPPMILHLIEMYSLNSDAKKIAVGVGTSSLAFLRQLPNAIDDLNKLGIEVKLIYLDAQTDILIKRFSETRRKHPLSDGDKTLVDCINEEREILSTISSLAHHIDTSELTANGLNHIIKNFVNADYSQLNIVIQSFGFKYGLPIDADFVFDVRCLPNPYYDQKLRNYDGTNEVIINFLDKEDKVQEMLSDMYHFISRWIKEFSLDNRNYVTVAVGCTGGKHRSVYLVTKLAKLIEGLGYKVLIRHRQI